MRTPRGVALLAAAGAVAISAACGGAQGARPAAHGDTGRKVMVIAEENHTFDSVIGNSKAPVMNGIADRYGVARAMDAGYPPGCPSLPAYLLMTSGSTHGICDDKPAQDHPLAGDNIFHQVAQSGRQWRNYAESMSTPCQRTDSGRYLSRHAPASYYRNEDHNCSQWDIPLGTVHDGPLASDLAHGTLPAYSFVTPDECHDMHGGDDCTGSLTGTADAWLGALVPQIEKSPDFTSGRLVVFVVWDEGSKSSNHIPFLVMSERTRHVSTSVPFTLCSLLRASEDLLQVPRLGCAASARPITDLFDLAA